MNSSTKTKTYFISFTIDPSWTDWIEEVCLDLSPVIIRENNTYTFQFYSNDKEQMDHTYNMLLSRLGGHTLDITEINYSSLAPEDWQDKWKSFFTSQAITDELLVKPVWEKDYTKKFPYIIEIDPGMAFGTGMHFTTQYCLKELLARKSYPCDLIDLGTGSGILSVLASMLNFNPITAIDIDPIAIQSSKKTASLNNTSNINFFVMDLSNLKLKPAQLVLANILGPILCRFASQINDCLLPDGELILSGIWGMDQLNEIKEIYLKNFSIINEEDKDNWFGISLKKQS